MAVHRIIPLAIVVLLIGMDPAQANHPVDVSDAKQVQAGRSVYRENCVECHGADLQGPANPKDFEVRVPPRLDAKGHAFHHGDQLFYSQILRGSRDKKGDLVEGGMPPFGGLLKANQIWAVISYIKSRWPVDLRKRQNRHNPGHQDTMGQGSMHKGVKPKHGH